MQQDILSDLKGREFAHIHLYDPAQFNVLGPLTLSAVSTVQAFNQKVQARKNKKKFSH